MANVDVGVRSTSLLASTSSAGQARQGSSAATNGGNPSNSSAGGQVVGMPAVTDPGIKAMLEQSASSAQLVSRDLKINVDDNSGKYVISVLDPETDEVIRQFPPQGALNMLETISRINEDDKGSLVNEKT